jgi:SET family sugar efflux transporter-like MFS transporter
MNHFKNRVFWQAAMGSLFASLASAAMMGMAVFLITDFFGLEKFYISIFVITGMLSAILVAPMIGKYSDKNPNTQQKALIGTAVIHLAGVVLFYFTNDFWLMLAINVTLMAFGGCCAFLITSYAKVQSRTFGKHANDAMMFNRAMVSLAWAFGPALSGFIVADYGFDALFIFLAIANSFALLFVISLPKIDIRSPKKQANTELGHPAKKLNSEAKFLLLAFLLLHIVIGAIIILLPLHIMDLGGAEKQTGQAFAIAAFIEIPILLFCGKFLSFTGNYRMLILIFVLAAISFIATGLTTSITQLLSLQALSGIMIALAMGIGMTLIQDTMPDSPATIISHYSNMLRLSILLGTAIAGIAADYMAAGSILSFMSILPAIGLILIISKYQKHQPNPAPLT